MDNNKPKYFLVLKFVALLGIALLVTGVIIAVKGFGDVESNNFMLGTFMAVFGLPLTFVGIFMGFGPEIAKMRAKSIKYIQQETKEDLTTIAQNTADISSGAVTTTARAVSEGLKGTKFCKLCGAKVDGDSKFCSTCGKEL